MTPPQPSSPLSLRYPSSPPPISHLMCGGCWDSHAKMNNNRLLVTTEHEHTRRLSLLLSFCRLLSHLLSLTHSNSIFSVIYEHIGVAFLCSVCVCVRVLLSTHQSETLTFGLKVIPHIPLFHTALMTRYQRGWRYRAGDNACVRAGAHVTAENLLFVVQYRPRLKSADTADVCRLR